MRKLALSDEILLSVDKAARYIGGEVNSVMKNLDGIDVRVAFCFPDVYEIGMSNLGMMLLYNMFNKRPDVWCRLRQSRRVIQAGFRLLFLRKNFQT